MEVAEELGVESPWPQVCIISGLLFLTIVEYSGIVDFFRHSYSKQNNTINESLIESAESAEQPSQHNHEDHHSIVVNGSVPVLLAVILSIHSMLESFSLGAAKDEVYLYNEI